MKNNVQKKLTRKLWVTSNRYFRNERRFRIRRNYKDRLFIQLFHDRKVLLELYNALNNSSYTESDELIITTIGDAIYLGMKNDCSFIIGNYLNLYEHQSTFCPNMPIRGLFYISDIYQAYVSILDLNLYGSSQIKLPTPKYVVFYNGEETHEDVEYLHLSDAFDGTDSCLEFTATMYNINMGHNAKLMEKCDTLQGYSMLIMKIREYQNNGMTLEEATDTACQYCIEHNILREFLLKNRSEVRRVLLTEYNAKHQRKLDQRDAKEEGLIEGRIEGRIEGLKRGELIGKVRIYAYEMHLNPEEIAQKVDADIETIEEILGK
jgi:hypothetical protein